MRFFAHYLSAALLWSTLIGCAPSRSGTAAQLTTSLQSLIGGWRLTAYEDWDSAGHRSAPYGEHPRGYLRYDADGTMSVQIMRTPALPAFAAGEDRGAAEEKAAAFDAYVAYFGFYTLSGPTAVLHHVEAALDPTYVGTHQLRPFRLAGDSLILGDERTWRRVFLRTRNP